MGWAKAPSARFRFLTAALALAALFSTGPSGAQPAARAMIKLRTEGSPAPRATIANMAWIEGHWIGEMPDGPVEHVVLSPRFGHLPGFVRALGDRSPVFYEISVFAEAGDSLTVRVKHFTPELAGWEAQSGYVDRPLVDRDATNFYFDGITFSRTGRDSFTVYFLNRSEGQERETLVIPFRRKSASAGTEPGVPAGAVQQQGRLVNEQLQSASFASSRIGISPIRNVTVYLPPGYAQVDRRFPVLYYLQHFFEDHREPFASHGAKQLLDAAIRAHVIGDVIVVAADFSTPAGSSWYVNSPVTGNWEDFLVRELVPHVDATYRTLASRNARGVVGDGVGGYGAIRLGMRHPELFGAVYGMHPVGTGPSIQPSHSRPDFDLLARARSLEDLGDDGYSRIFTSIYQAFSPNPGRPPLYFDPPARRVDGRLAVDSAVTARFHQGFSLTELLPAYADNLKSLRGFKFDWGRQDMLADHVYGAQALSHRLAEFGVPHEAEEHGGGFRDRHWGEQGRFYTDVLPFFAHHLLFGPPSTVQDRVTAAHGRLREALIANDPGMLAALYRADARSMLDYQPALYGRAQITAYHRAMGKRRRVTGYVPVATEILDLGTALVETGMFTITWSLATGATEEERGKYVHVWGVEPDGSLRLKSDVRGYFRRLPDPAAFFVDLPQGHTSADRPSAADSALERTLHARNARNAVAVRTHDAETQIADYSEDAVVMPFADTNKTGIAEIRPYLLAYTEAGRGATFGSVRVWNVGFEDFGAYVIEYPKFQVNWRSSTASGVVKGGGLRLWRRRADGSLALFRQIGTHDYR